MAMHAAGLDPAAVHSSRVAKDGGSQEKSAI
jgi:hypothetical protein